MSSTLTFENIGGEIDLAERGEKSENGLWASTELISYEWDNMNFEVCPKEDDESKLAIEIACWHAQNEETKRAFHCKLHAHLDRKQAEELYGYLGFLLRRISA